ncbi:hypothetical protein LTR62_008422 [Meristemomyces frigidus]|uniref:Uncharacterized protein n=1 Tax=Meristemomyces frigidus TaxID=1508187 RepID=A0AAN7YLU9_9PEZI|nr:hypothetical protein LTR62_008422 [Meristemomyces frigidus]
MAEDAQSPLEELDSDRAESTTSDLADATRETSEKKVIISDAAFQRFMETSRTALSNAAELMKTNPQRGHADGRGEQRRGSSKVERRRTETNSEERDVAQDAGAASNPCTTAQSGHKLRGSRDEEENTEQFSRDQLVRQQSNGGDGEHKEEKKSLVKRVLSRAPGHEARMRLSPADYNSTYYVLTKVRKVLSSAKREARIERQTISHKWHYEHGFRDDLWFRSTLEQLKQATPDEVQGSIRQMETARLPQGIRGVFNGNTGEAVLEIMLRTGSYIQLSPMRHDSGVDLAVMASERWHTQHMFSELQMYGTKAENAAALAVLPEMLSLINVEDETVRSKVRLEVMVNDILRNSIAHVEEDQDILKTKEKATYKRSNFLRAYWTSQQPSFENIIESRHNSTADGRVTFLRPKQWTFLTFNSYITDLTADPLRSTSRARSTQPHQPGTLTSGTLRQQITSEIHELFADPAATPHISSEAVNAALDLLVRYSDLAAVRSLVNVLSSSPYQLTTSNLDITLAAAARNEDPHNFKYILNSMLERGMAPSSRTWITLHRLVSRRYAEKSWADTLLQVMREKGILDSISDLQEAAKTRMQHDHECYLSKHGHEFDLDQFIAKYDQTFAVPDEQEPSSTRHRYAQKPRPWLSTTTANILAKSLLDHGRTKDALRIITLVEEAGHNIKIDTITTFLTSAARARDPSFAVEILKHFRPALTRRDKHRIVLDDRAYGLLFSVAWRKQCLNMLRVVWRYACCAGQATRDMMIKVEESLISYAPAVRSREQRAVDERKRDEVAERRKDARGSDGRRGLEAQPMGDERSRRGEVFFALAGKFAVGVSNDLHAARTLPFSPFVCIIPADSHLENHDIEIQHTDQPGHEKDPTPYSSPPRTTDASTTISSTSGENMSGTADGLLPHEQTLLSLTAHPRTHPSTTQSPNHKLRFQTFQSLLESDLNSFGSLQPSLSISDALEAAWQRDMQWHVRGLGMARAGVREDLFGKGADEEAKAKYFAGLLGEVLEEGLGVLVGDGRGG